MRSSSRQSKLNRPTSPRQTRHGANRLWTGRAALTIALVAGLPLPAAAQSDSSAPPPAQRAFVPKPYVPQAYKPQAFVPPAPASVPRQRPAPPSLSQGFRVDLGNRDMSLMRGFPVDFSGLPAQVGPRMILRFGGTHSKPADPIPIDFGGTKSKAPRMIGASPAPVITNDPTENMVRGHFNAADVFTRTPRLDRGPRTGGGLIPGPIGTRPTTDDPGFHGRIGSGEGVQVDYTARGDRFNFGISINGQQLNRYQMLKALHMGYGRWSPGLAWRSIAYDKYLRDVYNDGYGSGYVIAPAWGYADPALSTSYAPAQPDPAAQQGAAASQTDALQYAESLLGAERFKQAAVAYREHMAQHPDDADALRMLAVTLILDRRPREAADLMLAAYRMNPTLADAPVSLPAGLGNADLAAAAGRAIDYAQRSKDAGSWLAAAVLSHARAKTPVARQFAESARAAGLDPELYAKLMAAWST